MALNINTNIGALGAAAAASKTNRAMETAMERLASGLRINTAADDAAGVAISSRMEAQVRGLNQAIRNAADGQALADTAEGAMVEITNMLQRMRELAIQAANDTNSDSDREALNLEVEQLTAEIDRIVGTTQYNGSNILDGSAELNFQIGAQAGQTLNVAISSLGSNVLGSLTGAPSSSAVLTSSHQGVAAEVTEVKIAFNGNDTYSFNLNITDSAGVSQALAISADVRNGSAVDIAGAINAKIVDAGLDEYAAATVSGNVVTVKNSFGEDISLDTFSAVGTGTGTYTTINGGVGSSAVVNLGGASGNTGTTFTVNAPAVNYTAAVDATSGTAATFLETLTQADFTDITSWVAGDFGTAPGAATHLEVDFGDYSVTVALADATDIASFAAAINNEQSAYTFSAVISDAGGGALNYSLKAVANNVGVVAAGNVPTIKAIDANGATITDGAFANGLALTQDVAGVDATDAVAETGGTKLYLEMLGADTYSFTLDTVAISFNYAGTSASRDTIAADMEVALNAALADTYTVVNANGRLEITNQDNSAASLTAFASTGSGKIIASTTVGDGGAQGTTQILDDTVFAVAATTTAAGTATATVVDLEFTADDTYRFNVSDGVRTAVIDATEVDATTPDVTAMIAAIEYGLAQAGMDSSITVSNTGGVIHLTQAAGREVSISNFRSDGTGSMLASGGTVGTTGVSRYLDDGMGANASTVSEITVETSSGAADAIEILDRAISDVAAERAKLGAVSNRLDYTVANLTNISINTSAAQSRIQDADFAAESTNLAKAQILQQASMAMLAQANASKQGVLQLLQG